MKKIVNIIFSVVLILSLLIPTILYVPITVYASEDNNALYPYFDNNSQPTRKLTELLQLLTMQAGAFVTGDIENYRDCSEEIDKLFNYEYAKGQFVKNSDGGLTVKSDYINTLISGIKNGTQQKYGYTYVSTVPQSAFVKALFKNEEYYNSFLKAMSQSNGVVAGITKHNLSGEYFDIIKLPLPSEFVLVKTSGATAKLPRLSIYDLYGASFKYKLTYDSTTHENVDINKYSYRYDLDNYRGFESFVYWQQNDLTYGGMTSGIGYIISVTPMTLPYFDTLNAYQNYQLDKGGYYVGSKSSENISDITINAKELENLDFYSKLITDLYEQIRTSDFDYQEIADMIDKLSDEINQGLDEVKHEQQIGNTWLEKIYNAIIDLPNKITHSDNNSNDIDLTELNKSLTSVINKLDTINSKLNNIDTDNDNEKLTDIETAITDNKAVLNIIKTELTSQSVDIKEISTQLQSVADNLKDLSSDVDTINTELINVSNQLDNISKSLNDLAVTLENIEKELKDTNGLLADIKDTLKAIKNWLVADTIFDGIDLISDLAEFINEFMSDIDTGIATISSGLLEVAETFTKKFPFSIPWDIVFLIEFLADTPATPVFELPLKFDSFGIDEIIKIDFTRFEVISKISRLLLTMLFTLGLAKFTYNIISVKQGDN